MKSRLIKQRKPIPKRSRKPRRVSVARDLHYLRFIRAAGVCEACCQWPDRNCQLTAIEAAHGPVNGLSSKGSDYEAIPLGRVHHCEQHRVGWKAFCKKYGLNREGIVAYWNLRYTHEVIRKYEEQNGKR